MRETSKEELRWDTSNAQHASINPCWAPRHLAWLFLRDPKRLEKQEKQTLSLIRKTPNVETTSRLAQQLTVLVKDRNAQPLETWLWDGQMNGISDLVTFAQELKKEGSALHAALTLP